MGLAIDGWKIHFEYGQEPVTYFKKGVKKTSVRPKTVCVITNEATGVEYKSQVQPHHTDRRNRVVGRFYAFKQAIAQIADRGLRKQIFGAFLENVKIS